MKQKEIVFITTNLTQTGGLENVTVVLANELAKKKEYNIKIVNLGVKKGEVKYNLNTNVDIDYIEIDNGICNNRFDIIKSSLNNYLGLKKYAKLNFKNKSQIIIGMGTGISYLLPYIYNKKNSIIIGTQHNPVKHTKIMDIFRKITIKKMNYYIALDKDTKYDMEEKCKLKNIKVIPNPLTIKIDSKSNLSSKIVLAIGRLTKQKGFDLLLESWKLVSDSYPDWNLVIVGEGEEYEVLKNKIRSIGIEDSVYIKPFTKDVQKYYKDASIFVLSSRYEGFGLVLLEAQAFGLPVVAFDCPTGPRNIINDGVDGYLVEPNDIYGLSSKINKLIEDENLRTTIGKNAIKNSERFKIENIIIQWNDLIEDKFIAH